MSTLVSAHAAIQSLKGFPGFEAEANRLYRRVCERLTPGGMVVAAQGGIAVVPHTEGSTVFQLNCGRRADSYAKTLQHFHCHGYFVACRAVSSELQGRSVDPAPAVVTFAGTAGAYFTAAGPISCDDPSLNGLLALPMVSADAGAFHDLLNRDVRAVDPDPALSVLLSTLANMAAFSPGARLMADD